MRIWFFIMFLGVYCYGQQYSAASEFRLAPPQLRASSQLFTDSVLVHIQMDYPNTEIRYRTDGKAVAITDSLYQGPIVVTESSHIVARAFHPELIASEQVDLALSKVQYNITDSQIDLSVKAHQNYKGAGPSGLIDLQRGSTAFRGNKAWMGFQTDSLRLVLRLNEPLEVESLKLGYLHDQGSWIFGPAEVRVFHKEKMIGEATLPDTAVSQAKKVGLLSVPIEKDVYSEFNIHIYPLKAIPDWHDGAGTLPWLFLDEILLN